MTEVKDLTGKMRGLEEKSLTAKTRAQRIFSPRRTGEYELRGERDGNADDADWADERG